MKGVVWRAKDDTGEDVALKFMPEEEYFIGTLLDEMTEAKKLPTDTFATITAFGSLCIPGYELKNNYKAIATEWINGIPLDKFVKKYINTVSDAMLIADKLFSIIAILRSKGLCHDDLHPGNILMSSMKNIMSNDEVFVLKVIDTGTIKRLSSRELLFDDLKKKIDVMESAVKSEDNNSTLNELRKLLAWKTPDDHLRIVECFLHVANALNESYYKLDFWEKKFTDELLKLFQRLGDANLECRLDDPSRILNELKTIERSSKTDSFSKENKLSTPFDFISAEMITNDRQFAELFSMECPWLNDCKSLEPIYIYGPRGCGKSSVLRWLSFKTILSDNSRNTKIDQLHEIGIYVSCSVELRSRFWLFTDETIDRLQGQIILFFNLLLLEELFDTLRLMHEKELANDYDFNMETSDKLGFVQWVLERFNVEAKSLRLQGQNPFEYLRSIVRGIRWDTWAEIQKNKQSDKLPYSALVSDVCRILPEYFNFFKDRHITFLVDDYSNQRIPVHLQKKLNQTISFAKQGTPIFKVSSEYQGVDLEGIQEGREVTELNIGDKYTAQADDAGYKFLSDIMNLRLKASEYKGSIDQILGKSLYPNITRAIAEESISQKFYYYGIDCVHQLCSGDVALALDLIKRIFDHGRVNKNTTSHVSRNTQHEAIQEFSYRELRQIRNIVPFGPEMYEVICHLGYLARAIVKNKKSNRRDKKGDPVCMTHLDVRDEAIKEVKRRNNAIWQKYDLLKSRTILLSLYTSRSRIEGSVEKLQMRKIYFPAFKAPLKRDTPIKIDSADDLESMLTNPRTFAERELNKADVDIKQLQLAINAMDKPLRRRDGN
jgi:serine/threonine protein kinase